MNHRLAGWKLKSLSHAARLLLIKSTLRAIPIYSMQTNRVPANTIKEVEGLCRNFFWSSTREHRCMHTIAWSKICRPLRLGGLGITSLRVNEALLSKLLWQLVKQLDKLSSQILQDKYGGWQSIMMGNWCWMDPISGDVWVGHQLYFRGEFPVTWEMAGGLYFGWIDGCWRIH